MKRYSDVSPNLLASLGDLDCLCAKVLQLLKERAAPALVEFWKPKLLPSKPTFTNFRTGHWHLTADFLPILAECIGDPRRIFQPFLDKLGGGWAIVPDACSSALGITAPPDRNEHEKELERSVVRDLLSIDSSMAVVSKCMERAMGTTSEEGSTISRTERAELAGVLADVLPNLIERRRSLWGRDRYGAWSHEMLQGLRVKQQTLAEAKELGVSRSLISKWKKDANEGDCRLPADALPGLAKADSVSRVFGPYLGAVGCRVVGVSKSAITDDALVNTWLLVKEKQGVLMGKLKEHRTARPSERKGWRARYAELARCLGDMIDEMTEMETALRLKEDSRDERKSPKASRAQAA